MNSYIEHEVKILDIDVEKVQSKLEALGAVKVYDDERVLTTFDTKDFGYKSQRKSIRLTEEGKLKLSVSSGCGESKETVKLFTSRKEETVDFLSQLGLYPITEVKARRISYEWNEVDFDIDIFSEIPAFLEIDIERLTIPLEELLIQLGLNEKRRVVMGTKEIFQEVYGKDFYELFKI